MRFLLASSLLVVACASRGEQTGTARPIEVVVPNEISTLDPRYATRSLDVKVTRLLHAGLVGLDAATLEPVPLAAQSWSWEGDRVLHVVLREDALFHGGARLVAEDVCATVEAVKDPSLASPHRAVVESISTCRGEGEQGVRLELGVPRATLLTDLEIPILRANQARGPRADSGELDGLGPYAVGSFERGALLLVPKATGVGPAAHHAVVVRTVRDENARAERLLAGRSDVAPNAISPALLPVLDGRDDLSVVSRPGANVTYLLFQNDRAPFDRREVRRAVAQAIDRALVARTLLAGRATPAASMLPGGHWAAAPVNTVAHDPAAARAVLSSLTEVTLLTSTERARVTIARAVAQMTSDAGMPTRVVPIDLGVMLARLDAGDFEMAILQIPELTEPNVLSWFLHPRGVPGEGGQGKNRGRYRNPVAAALFDEAGSTVDRTARKAAYAKLLGLLAEDAPVVPLWHEDQTAVVSSRARGFRPSAEGRWSALAGLE